MEVPAALTGDGVADRCELVRPTMSHVMRIMCGDVEVMVAAVPVRGGVATATATRLPPLCPAGIAHAATLGMDRRVGIGIGHRVAAGGMRGWVWE